MMTAFYARVSTPNQTQAQTIEQQLERLRSHAKENDWPVEEGNIFCDDGHSGSSLNRPALERLRFHVKRRLFDQIIITAPDRLARNYVVVSIPDSQSFLEQMYPSKLSTIIKPVTSHFASKLAWLPQTVSLI